MTTSVRENYQRIKQRITQACQQYQRDPAEIGVLAVSKQQSLGKITDLYDLGVRQFGENYLQEALDKIQQCPHPDIAWHFIGRIQANKTKLISQHFTWVHSVTRAKIAERLAAARESHQPPLNICIQVNLAGDTNKDGVDADEAHALAALISGLPHIRLRGLMAVPPASDDFAMQCREFTKVKQLYDRLCAAGFMLDTLSLGMSADLEAAIACGSNVLRIGTALFGQRPQQKI